MNEKTKVVEIDGQSYQFRKMMPNVGSYIWQRLMAATYKSIRDADVVQSEEAVAIDEVAPKPSSEDRLRGLCGIAFMHLDFTDHTFIQRESMRVTARLENGLPMPVMADSGQWAAPDIADNPLLVTRLTAEALVHNLHPYLDALPTKA